MPAKAPQARSPEMQLQFWIAAVQLLGGQRCVARLLNSDESTIRALCSGESALDEGWLRGISRALLAHAEHCRKLERKLDPAFLTNLTAEQAGTA